VLVRRLVIKICKCFIRDIFYFYFRPQKNTNLFMKTQMIQGYKQKADQLLKNLSYNKPMSRRNLTKESVESKLYQGQGIQGASQETKTRTATMQHFYSHKKHKRQSTQDKKSQYSFYKETRNQFSKPIISHG
jgi:hypothetical protein